MRRFIVFSPPSRPAALRFSKTRIAGSHITIGPESSRRNCGGRCYLNREMVTQSQFVFTVHSAVNDKPGTAPVGHCPLCGLTDLSDRIPRSKNRSEDPSATRSELCPQQ